MHRIKPSSEKQKNHIHHCRHETQRKGIGIYSRNRSRDQVIRTVSNAFAEIKEKKESKKRGETSFFEHVMSIDAPHVSDGNGDLSHSPPTGAHFPGARAVVG